jgi:hypothetical protein
MQVIPAVAPSHVLDAARASHMDVSWAISFKLRYEANVGIGSCVSPQPNTQTPRPKAGRLCIWTQLTTRVKPSSGQQAGKADYLTIQIT